jgi:hypothetical protein
MTPTAYTQFMTIDTLEYAKKLEAAGVDRKQAEAHAEALRSVTADQLATKQDLDTNVALLRSDFNSAVQRLDNKIDRAVTDLEMRLIKYMVGQTFAIVALVFALLRWVR